MIKFKITQPLILISQIQRSGGSMMAQLFDGHSEILAHPLELKLNKPKWDWSNFNNLYLYNDKKWKFFSDSEKFIKGRNNIEDGNDFIFDLTLQKNILDYYIKKGVMNERELLNSYFTSFFNAFKNYKIENFDKKYITAFTPRININDVSVKKYFSIYPDGFFLTIIRNPKNWLASAFFHAKIYSNVNEALLIWLNSTKKSINITKNFQNSMLINFDNLINMPKLTMQIISKKIGLKYEDILSIPTFNNEPILSNSSFKNSKNIIIKDTLDRWKELDNNIKNIINKKLLNECLDIYNYCSEKSINKN